LFSIHALDSPICRFTHSLVHNSARYGTGTVQTSRPVLLSKYGPKKTADKVGTGTQVRVSIACNVVDANWIWINGVPGSGSRREKMGQKNIIHLKTSSFEMLDVFFLDA
jgi:hypothetical protein